MKKLRARIEELAEQMGSQNAVSRVMKINAGYLSRIKNGTKNPSDRILRKLGMRRVITFERTNP